MNSIWRLGNVLCHQLQNGYKKDKEKNCVRGVSGFVYVCVGRWVGYEQFKSLLYVCMCMCNLWVYYWQLQIFKYVCWPFVPNCVCICVGISVSTVQKRMCVCVYYNSWGMYERVGDEKCMCMLGWKWEQTVKLAKYKL